ncbi:MAG: carbon-nitrogen hydrolase family protein [Defluviitaleaceae bacterium]|nr:carbon-nitrogen hydrolase family protein [Defluviitaleaceae bacterium]
MRKVRVGAIQSAALPIPDRYQWTNNAYAPDVDAILERVIIPQAEVTFGLLEQAGEAGLDIVTTSEDLSLASAYVMDTSENNIFPEIVRRGFPLWEERISRIAERYGMNVVACYFKPDGDAVYNTASVFNRKGKIIGEYRKTHIPCFEAFQVNEGDSIHTVDTDIGKIGIMICYDMMFPSVSDVLSQLGAEIIFHPTFGYGWYDSIGEATLRTRANDGSLYIVTAKDYRYNAAGKSSVIDPWGHVLADAAYSPNVIVSAEIDLDARKTQPDWYLQTEITGCADMRKRHAAERRPELYAALGEAAPQKYNAITSPGKAQAEFLEKFKRGVYRW